MPRRPASASLAGVVFALLVLATLAAFAWSQRLKRDPLVLDKVSFVGFPVLHPKHPVHSFTPNGDCRYDRVRIRFRITRSDDGTVQVVKPGGRVVITLARDRFLKRYHFHTFYWDGRSRGGGIAPPGRYKLRVKLLGQDRTLVPPGAIQPAPRAARPAEGLRPSRSGGELSDFLAGAGVLVAAAAAAAAILLPAGRARSAAMLVALVLFPALILGDQWHSHQIVDLRDDAARLAALGLAGLAVSPPSPSPSAAGRSSCPWRSSPPSPSAVPLHAGGDTANLLVPLYLVIAGGVLATRSEPGTSVGSGGWRGDGGPRTTQRARPQAPPRPRQDPPADPLVWLPRILAAVVVLYALQTLYSPDFSKGLQNVCFFFVPFSLVYALLRDVEWDRRLLALVLWVVGIEAVAFVAGRHDRVR